MGRVQPTALFCVSFNGNGFIVFIGLKLKDITTKNKEK